MRKVRLLIADDHDAVRRGVRSLVSSHPEWLVCGEAVDGVEAIEKVRELRPDVVLMDISMPRMDGVQATRILRDEIPESRIIIVSQNDPSTARLQAAEVGAQEFVTKGTLARDLLPAIIRVVETIPSLPASDETPSVTPDVRETTRPAGSRWLHGGGTLGKLIREYDWSQTPLGEIGSWPQSLRASVNLMLNSQHPMWIGWGREMVFLYNDAYISVLSLTKHPRSLGRPAREVWSEIWDVVGPLSAKVFEEGEPFFVDDLRLFMRRGDYLEETFYSFSYSPIYDESGKVAGLFCPSAETTAKNLNTRRLRTLSELSAKALVEKSIQSACRSSLATIALNPDDIPFALLYLLDNDHKIARLEGVSASSGSLAEIAAPELRLDESSSTSQLWPLQEVVTTSQPKILPIGAYNDLPMGPAGQPVTEAIVLPVTSPGQVLPIGALISGVNPTRGLDTEYRTFFKLVSDQVGTAIQNAKAAEDEKKRADALAELDRAKTVFFSNVSHEFRTPLTLMLGALEDMLAEPESLSVEDRERLQVAHRNSLRLLKQVNTLLDFSRIESGRIQASYDPIDLSVLTADLASVFRSAIERAGLHFSIDCPPLKEHVYVDREMWEKIVFNLLSNALKFTFTGEIAVSLRDVGNAVQLSVTDTGTGIPADELPHIFERFHRVKGARGRTFEGSGIGLALVRELAQLHGGKVEVESKPDRGTTFTVTVPLGSAHLPKERIGSDRALSSTAVQAQAYIHEALDWVSGFSDETLPVVPVSIPVATSGSAMPPRILLADDNADMREYIRRLLASAYEVEAVADGQSALESIRRRRPDLVLSDVMMPKLDGFGLLKALRRDEKTATIPVILLSARAGEESRVEGIGAGADDYLIKPFSARELAARIETHLKLAQVRAEAEQRSRRLAETLDKEVRVRTRELEQRNVDVIRQSEILRVLSHRMMQMQDEERRHIARELHDSAGQTLAVLAMRLSHLVQQAESSAPNFAKDVQETNDLVQQLSREIRTTSYLLHPPLLDETGLAPALKWYLDGLKSRSTVSITLEAADDFGRLPRDMELVLFRLVQECLTNIHRHSGSKTATIMLARDQSSVSLEVRDQGIGIPPEKLVELQSQGSGVGILGMRERVRQFKGEMNIKSSSAGTVVLVTLPVPSPSSTEGEMAPIRAAV